MKQLLLHGPAINSSRSKLSSIRKDFDISNIVVFESGAKVEEILGQIETIPLIDNKRLIIWENPPEDLRIPTQNNSNLTVVLWFDHEVDSKDLPVGEIFFFPEEKEASIFPLLDCLGNKDKRAYLELQKRNKTSPNDTQYILTMVFYLLRSLVFTPKKASDFVRRKNENMRSNFSREELVKLYKSVIDLDFKIKSGLLEIPQAEFNLVNLFLD